MFSWGGTNDMLNLPIFAARFIYIYIYFSEVT